MLRGAETCLNEPLSVLVDTTAYSASSSALFAVRVSVLVLGFQSPLCLDCGGMKNPLIGG